MPTSKLNVRIPQITSLETAIRLYYERNELSNDDIRELFGKLGHSTVSRLKKAVVAETNARGTPIWNAARVNTEVAYEVWGLDIKRLENSLKKLRAMNLEGVKNQ
ncbi:MAG TPA: hypothetical protein DEQ68_09730 [Ruminococcaceae bacterium]|nr:hypothetical protein [Oscillospiraceae bacterium]